MSILRLSTLSLTLAIAVMTLGYANPSFADKPNINDCEEPAAGHCHDDDFDKRGKTFYDVLICPMNCSAPDAIFGHSDDLTPWSTFGNGTSIGLGDADLSPPGDQRPGIGEFTDLSFFSSLDGLFRTVDGAGNTVIDQGIICFPPETGDGEHVTHTNTHRDEGTFSIHQGNVREGRHGRAQAGFFFHGFTHTDVDGAPVKVLYHLLLTGIFGSELLPPIADNEVVLSMDHWELSVTNEGQAIKSISCIGEGTVMNVDVTVTEHLN